MNMEPQTQPGATAGDAREIALRLRTDPDPAIRAKAALALDELRDGSFLADFLIALNDSDWFVRSNAGWGLVHLGEVVRQPIDAMARTGLNLEAREMAELVLERLVSAEGEALHI